MITIRAVDADGKLDASYANPRPLPFHVAVASRDGNALKLLFELRAGGYNGSTYTLSYDAANDRLTGVYDQVVVKAEIRCRIRSRQIMTLCCLVRSADSVGRCPMRDANRSVKTGPSSDVVNTSTSTTLSIRSSSSR